MWLQESCFQKQSLKYKGFVKELNIVIEITLKKTKLVVCLSVTNHVSGQQTLQTTQDHVNLLRAVSWGSQAICALEGNYAVSLILSDALDLKHDLQMVQEI